MGGYRELKLNSFSTPIGWIESESLSIQLNRASIRVTAFCFVVTTQNPTPGSHPLRKNPQEGDFATWAATGN